MIAGAGEIPLLIARRACKEGWSLPTVALSEQVAAALTPYCPALVHCGPGQITKILRTLRRHDVRRVVIVGKVQKQFLFEKPRFDLRALRLLSRLRDYRDAAVFRAISAEFDREGLEIVAQTTLLGHLLTPEGVMTARRPSAREWDDIRYGFAQAKAIVALDIGQTLVVRHRTVLAVEAAEGTDEAIRRGCAYSRRGAIVVKVSPARLDARFDIPTVGPQTLEALRSGRASVLAVEAGTTFMLHRDDLLATANAHRIALVGVTPAILEHDATPRR
jgi:DUF1009 family protein